MTIFSLTALTICMMGEVVVHVAPDQPLPIVYMDDPLVMEFVADEEGAYTVEVTVTVEGHESEILTLDTIPLQAGRPYWTIVKGLTLRRGSHQIDTVVTSSTGIWESTDTIHRIDRALDNTQSLVSISFLDDDLNRGRAVLEIPHHAVRWSGSINRVPEFLQQQNGMDGNIYIDIQSDSLTANAVTVVAEKLGKSISGWQIETNGQSQLYASSVQAIRKGQPLAQIKAYFTDPNDLGTQIRNGTISARQHIAIPYTTASRSNYEVFNAMAERSGLEGLHMSLCVSEPTDSSTLMKTLFLSLTQPVSGINLPLSLLYSNEDDLSPEFSAISRVAHLSNRLRFIGALDIEDGIKGYVFRQKDPDHPKRWSILTWANENPGQYDIRVDDASAVALQDALNNPIDTRQQNEGLISIPLDARPNWLQGDRGVVLAQAASNQIKEEAISLSDNEIYMAILPKSVQDMISNLRNCDPATSKRLAFFTLLRAFPAIESSLQSGNVPKSIGIPVCASLTRIAMALAVMEQETGTPFLEPIGKIRASATEFQSAYRTRTATASGTYDRPGWVMTEVSRLLEVSQELSNEGRPIEAAAIASLGEWRARSLEAYTQ